MHIIHHIEARELLFMLPISDEEVFHLVERKVYRVIGEALADGFPIVEFIGGRKNKDSLYTKLLSKPEVSAAQIYDKLRFRIVTRDADDIFPMLRLLHRRVFPFNFGIPGQATNTLFHFRSYCEADSHLAGHLSGFQLSDEVDDVAASVDNNFSDPGYRIVHFVVDMPVRLPDEVLREAPPAAWALGPVVFVLTEFQVLDEDTDQRNELGDASHSAYKARQKLAVMRRLAVGNLPRRRRKSDPPPAHD
jgi:uncharacterized protein (TIGR04552 family)